jgi:hypothetical protein
MTMGSKRRRHEDDDELSIRKKDGGKKTLFVGLAIGGVALILLTCMCGGGIGLTAWLSRDATAAKLPGAWKGRFVLAGQPLDVTYTFNKDGSFRQDGFDGFGRKLPPAAGRWRMEKGELVINWDNGTFEKATVHWIDDRTMDYRIVDHTDRAQIDTATTFKRQ